MSTPVWADLSHHQESVDFAAYAAAGHRLVGIKATGGATDGTLRYIDPMFHTRWQQAGRTGLVRVAYHYARNNNDGTAEFTWCLSKLIASGGLSPADVLCYDQEDTRPGAQQLAVHRTQQFVGAAVAAGIRSGWIYSGTWYLEPAGLRAEHLPPGWRNLWLSDYGQRADDQIPVPDGWSRPQIVARQYTDHATIAGIGTPCDASRMLRAPVEPPPPKPLEEPEMFVVVRDGVAFLVRDHGMVPINAASLAACRKVMPVVDFTAEEVGALRAALGVTGIGDALMQSLTTLTNSSSSVNTQLRSIADQIVTISRASSIPVDAGALAANIAERLQTLILDGIQATATVQFQVGTDEP